MQVSKLTDRRAERSVPSAGPVATGMVRAPPGKGTAAPEGAGPSGAGSLGGCGSSFHGTLPSICSNPDATGHGRPDSASGARAPAPGKEQPTRRPEEPAWAMVTSAAMTNKIRAAARSDGTPVATLPVRRLP